ALLANPVTAPRRDLLRTGAILAIALIPLIVEPSLLAVLFGVFGAAYVAVAIASRPTSGCVDRITGSALLLFDICWRALSDIANVAAWWLRGDRTASWLRDLVVWVVPLALGAVFLVLFAVANPLIEHWLSAIDLRAASGLISFERIAFWLVVAAV